MQHRKLIMGYSNCLFMNIVAYQKMIILKTTIISGSVCFFQNIILFSQCVRDESFIYPGYLYRTSGIKEK